MTNIEDWLRDLGLGQYCPVFADNDIDFDVLPDLAESDLEGSSGIHEGDVARGSDEDVRLTSRSAGWPLSHERGQPSISSARR